MYQREWLSKTLDGSTAQLRARIGVFRRGAKSINSQAIAGPAHKQGRRGKASTWCGRARGKDTIQNAATWQAPCSEHRAPVNASFHSRRRWG